MIMMCALDKHVNINAYIASNSLWEDVSLHADTLYYGPRSGFPYYNLTTQPSR